jgi:hypothetical protein
MNETVRNANSRVLFNPYDAPAAVRSSNEIAAGVSVGNWGRGGIRGKGQGRGSG